MKRIKLIDLQEIYINANERNCDWRSFLNQLYNIDYKYVNIKVDKNGIHRFYFTDKKINAIRTKWELGLKSKVYKII